MTDLTSSSDDELNLQMQITQEFHRGLRTEKVENGEEVNLRFSLFAQIPDPERRADMLRYYETALREVVPTMAERLNKPLVMLNELAQSSYAHQMDEAIGDTMRHVRAIWEGTHKWSPLLAPTAAETPEEEKQLGIFSGCNLALVAQVDPETGEGSFAFFFYALLYDLHQGDKSGMAKPLDSDPVPSATDDEDS